LSERRELINKIPRMVAFYGKAGIGKTTTSSNVSAAISHTGEKIMQVGCDPKRDSVATLCHKLVPTILSLTQKEEKITDESLNEMIFEGYNGIICAESGGPRPGIGCAGRGVLAALQLIRDFKIFEKYGITFVLFDVLGDVVCGGFAQPMRSGYARETYIITSGEPLTLFMTNNLAKAVQKLAAQGADVGIAGLIDNQRMVSREREIVEDFAKQIGVPVIEHIPRSKVVQEAEFQGKTVIEAFPESEQAEIYRKLAKKVLDNKYVYVPKPLQNMDEVLEIFTNYM
jgi:nitrogenase iron protein NifH